MCTYKYLFIVSFISSKVAEAKELEVPRIERGGVMYWHRDLTASVVCARPFSKFRCAQGGGDGC